MASISVIVLLSFSSLLSHVAHAAFTRCSVTLHTKTEYQGHMRTWEVSILGSPKGSYWFAEGNITEILGAEVRSYNITCIASPTSFGPYLLHKTFMRFYPTWLLSTEQNATEGYHVKKPYMVGSWPNWEYNNMNAACDPFVSLAIYFDPWGSLKVPLAEPMALKPDADEYYYYPPAP